MFADDTQFHFAIRNAEDTLMIINNLIKNIKDWMPKTLKLYEKKTECNITGTIHCISKYSELQFVYINSEEIEISALIRILRSVTVKYVTYNYQI